MTSTQQYVLISIKGEALFKAIGVYQNEQDAYAAATVCQMQSIEKLSAKWPKSMLADKQESIMELCRCIKEDFKSHKERFAYMTLQCNQIFPNLEYDQHRILPVEANNNIPSHSISESIFKTKVRNFMDVLRTRSDVEEDLGNSEDDDDEDDEEEEENEGEEDDGGEEDIDDGEEEDMEDEDIEEEDVGEEADEGVDEDEDEDIQAEEEEEEEDDPVTSETVIQEHSEEEESEDQERPMLKRDASSLLEDGDAEDDEEDEIDEDEGDEDELADDDDESVKRRRVVA